MPKLKREQCEIYYEVHGEGYPVFLFAPGFLSSRIERWRRNPARPGQLQDFADPIPVYSPHFKVIAADIRNAGQSRGSVKPNDGWHTYIEDTLALLDHLKVTRCHIMGACIGVTFAFALGKAKPGLVSALVLQNPIGLGRNGRNRKNVDEEFNLWFEQVKGFPGLDLKELPAFGQRLFGGDFLFGVPKEFLASCKLPSLLMPGDDMMHPTEVSYEIVRLMPHTEVVAPWKGVEFRDEAVRLARDFLLRHTPR